MTFVWMGRVGSSVFLCLPLFSSLIIFARTQFSLVLEIAIEKSRQVILASIILLLLFTK